MCQVHTGAYVSQHAPGRTDYLPLATQERKPRILHVIPITAHTHVRSKSTGNTINNRNEEKGRKATKNEQERKRGNNGKKKKHKKSKQRLDKIRKQ